METMLDLRTLAIVLTLISFALSAVMFFVWRSSKTYVGFGWWTAGNTLCAFSFLLIIGQGSIPAIISVSLSNTLGVGALLVAYVGIRTFFGRSRRLYLVAGFLLLNAIFNVCFVYIVDSVVMRISIISLAVAMIAVLSASEFHRIKDRHRGRINLVARSSYLIFAVCMTLRSGLTYFVAPIPNLYSPSWVQSWAFIVFVMFDVLWTFNYLILNSQRLQDELQDAHSELEMIATTDFLTGAANSRSFFEHGMKVFSGAQRFKYPLSVIMFDLDGFKQINDTYGHAAGDEILKAVVTESTKMLRSNDTLARLGGDEFVITLSHTTADNAGVVAGSLRESIAAIKVECGVDRLNVTASFGIAEMNGADVDLQSTLARADEQLYRAKRSGRNCVSNADVSQELSDVLVNL